MRAKHLRQIIKLASQLVKILKADPGVSETMSTLLLRFHFCHFSVCSQVVNKLCSHCLFLVCCDKLIFV